MSVPGGEGSGDILSLALEQSGLDSNTTCHLGTVTDTFLSSDMTNEFFASLAKSSGGSFCQRIPIASSNGFGIQGVTDTSCQLMRPSGGGVEMEFVPRGYPVSRMDTLPHAGITSVEDGLNTLINCNGSDCLHSYMPSMSPVPSLSPATVTDACVHQSNNDIDDVLEELGIIDTSPSTTVITPYSPSCSYSAMAGPVGIMDPTFTQQPPYSIQAPAVMPYQQR